MSIEKSGLKEIRAPTRRESGVSPVQRGLSSCPSSNASAICAFPLEEADNLKANTLRFLLIGDLVMVKKMGFTVSSLKLNAIC